MARAVPWQPRGVLDAPAVRAASPAPGRFLPEAPLDAFVEHFWSVAWDLRGQPPVTRQTLPHPSIHLVIEAGASHLVGVATGRFTRVLEGCGRVLGIKFRPGCFHPFRPGPMSALTNRMLSLEEALGREGLSLEAAVLAQGDDAAAAAAAAEAFLLARLPAPDPQAERARDLVAQILAEPELTRVEELARRAGLSTRSLQRLFGSYVGVSPKWVIRRYRLHEAVARLDAGRAVDLPRLAIELGYFDQAHFIRDFKQLVGRTPAAYARAPETPSAPATGTATSDGASRS